MKFTETPLNGAYILDVVKHEDDRGFFARQFCINELADHDLESQLVQCNISFNHKKGTFRGMHFQRAPHAEDKIVSCTQGAILDIIVDLRQGSETFKQWTAVELSAENHRMLYVPKGFAHGFLTLKDDTVVYYQMTEFFHPESAGGFRWNDEAFDIMLPAPIEVISDRDATYTAWKQEEASFVHG
ncbi:MAG: dTDP-4-dehydrorhamnose 3,5-epimerase [Bacteroidota bacterium]